MQQYIDLLDLVLDYGSVEEQRAGADELTTRALYNQRISFNLRFGFPLVTVKKTSFKIVKEELKWFLRGENNVKTLQEVGVRIWDPWADDAGALGGSYPGCWRHFGGKDGADQIRYIVDGLERLKTNPRDPVKRRMILSSWDPNIRDNRGPVGCHTLAQWCVDQSNEVVHCGLTMRSVDLFLGLPYNIGCYALLTHLFAKIGGVEVGNLVINMGNAHIYSNHINQVKEVTRRAPMRECELVIKEFNGIDDWDAGVIGYVSHPAVSGDVAV